MTKNLLQIVPYIATHGKIILANQMNHVLMDKDAQYEGDAMQLEQNGLAYTCIINDEPIASAGMKIIWDGVAEGWVLATGKVWNHPLVIARAIKKNFARLAKENNIPIKEDSDLVHLLSQVDLNREIPASLYQVVAELLSFVYKLNGEYSAKVK